jgi:hypothetical protein
MQRLLLIACLGSTLIAQEAPVALAQVLVPLLKDARHNAGSHLVVEPGTAEPSPITGRNSTIAAVTIAKRPQTLEPEVNAAIDRLLAWNVREPLGPADRELVLDWVEELRVDVLGLMAGTGTGVGCDDTCLRQHLTDPGGLFGTTEEERVRRRNDLLLEAFREVVKK